MSELLRPAAAEAEERGVDMVLPESPQDLFIDIDNAADEEILLRHLTVLAHFGVHVKVKKHAPSPSNEPGHMHYYLHVDPEDLDLEYMDLTPAAAPYIRILLQAVLGSDRKRELLSFLRLVLNTGQPPTVFFESKPGTEANFDL